MLDASVGTVRRAGRTIKWSVRLRRPTFAALAEQMKMIPHSKAEWQDAAVSLTAYPLLILVGTQLVLFHLDLSAAVAYMQRPALLILEASLAFGLLVASLAMLFIRPKLGFTGLFLLVLGILVFLMAPAVTICY